MTEIIQNVFREDLPGCVIYYIESLSDEFKQEIRNRLVAVCHGADQAKSDRLIYSYKATIKEFIKRYNQSDENRKKGSIGELLVHILLAKDDRFTTASPFFNLEERSFKKGFDVVLFEKGSGELWITEVKSGNKNDNQKNASSAIVGLINKAKNDLKKRLNEKESTSLWLNAINAAKSAMSKEDQQKDAVIDLLEQCGGNVELETNTSSDFNVVLSGVLFHSMGERMEPNKIVSKQVSVDKEGIFNKVFVLAIQKNTYEAVFKFLESEAE